MMYHTSLYLLWTLCAGLLRLMIVVRRYWYVLVVAGLIIALPTALEYVMLLGVRIGAQL
jgi:hypothetical protein